MKKINIGIIGTGVMSWGGGIDFLIDYIKIFQKNPNKYSFVVFLPKFSFIKLIKEKIKNDKFNRNRERVITSLKEECPDVLIVYYNQYSLFNKSKDIKSKAKQHGIDVLLPMNLLIKNLKDDAYVTMSYIFDFQHKYYPEFFTENEKIWRDKYFYEMLHAYDFSFTQSIDTKNDIRKFYGNVADSVYIMYAYPHKVEYTDKYLDIKTKYNICEHYFMVCNQFWLHKNHKVVFDALECLYKEGKKDIMVVCTGDTDDYRDKGYFASLIKYIETLECRNNIKILGYIDKKDQIYLLNHCISLVQPTLFEGNPGGGAVVDAEAYGVPCIVSDINVNLEIPKCYDIKYFNSKDKKDLASKMMIAIDNYNPQMKYIGKSNYDEFYKEYDKVIEDIMKRKLHK